MKKTLKSAKPVASEAIAKMADRGQDISHFFKGEGRMVQPVQRVNVDHTAGTSEELDRAARDLKCEPSGSHQNAGQAGSRSALPGAKR